MSISSTRVFKKCICRVCVQLASLDYIMVGSESRISNCACARCNIKCEAAVSCTSPIFEMSFRYLKLRDNAPRRSNTFHRSPCHDGIGSESSQLIRRSNTFTQAATRPTALPAGQQKSFSPVLRSQNLNIREPEQGRLHVVLQRMASRRRRQQLNRQVYCVVPDPAGEDRATQPKAVNPMPSAKENKGPSPTKA